MVLSALFTVWRSEKLSGSTVLDGAVKRTVWMMSFLFHVASYHSLRFAESNSVVVVQHRAAQGVIQIALSCTACEPLLLQM